MRTEGLDDPQTALKQRLLDLTKENRQLLVTVNGQRSRISQLELEAQKPLEEAKKQAEEPTRSSCQLMTKGRHDVM